MPSKKIKRSESTQARGCEMIKGSTAALNKIRTLPQTAIILLLTPVMYTVEHIDPFEPLGRAISKQHSRVRHVPYIGKLGFTDTHHQFMQQADVVIIASVDYPPSIMKDEGTDMADSVFEFVAEASSVPIVHIQFGEAPIKVSDADHEVCIKASHATPEVFSWATCLLFDREE